jgi:hypothetical protein
MANLKLIRVAEAKEGARREAIAQINRILKPTFNEMILPDVKRLFLAAMGRNDIIKGILGYFPDDEDKDIQAIFGLSDYMASDAIEEMISVVESSLHTEFKISYPPGKTTIRYTFRFFWKDLEKNIRNMKNAEYVYAYKTTSFGKFNRQYIDEEDYYLPWIQWLLDGVYLDSELTFEDNSKGTALQKTRSRRARMLRLSTSGWSWEGVNFIEQVVYSPYFVEKLNKLYTEKIRKEILSGIRSL